MNPVLKNHINNFNNPHQVTADQVGAPSDQEFSNHVNDKTNPHQVTASQVGALSTNGGTVNGAVTITGNLTLSNGNVIVSDGTMNVQAGTSVNFQTPTLTQNGQPIGGGKGYVLNSFQTTSDSTSITLGPFDEEPVYIVIYMGNNGSYNSGNGGSLAIGAITSISTSCSARYKYVLDNGTASGGGGEIGTLSMSGGKYIITCTKNNFLGSLFFPGSGLNYFTTCAYFN